MCAMGSRQLPGCRTLRFALPASTRWTDGDDHAVFDTPACRETRFGHRLVLDAAPAEVEPWLDRWRAAHAGKGVDRAILVWEARTPTALEVPPGATLTHHRCLMFDLPLDPDAAPAAHDVATGSGATPRALRPLAPADAPELATLLATVEEDGSRSWARYAAWYAAGVLGRCAAGTGQLFGAFRAGELVATAGVMFDTREARVQAVATRSDHRRQGLCTALLHRAVCAYQEVTFGIVYCVTEPEGDAARLYRRLGFRDVTWFHELDLPAT